MDQILWIRIRIQSILIHITEKKHVSFSCILKLPTNFNELVYSKLNTVTSSKIRSICSKLTFVDQVDLCNEFNLTLPGVWPLLFRKPGYPQSDLASFFVKDPMSLLLKYLSNRSQIIIPKHIVINDIENDRELYFGEDFTAPSETSLRNNNLFGHELGNVYVISKRKYMFDKIIPHMTHDQVSQEPLLLRDVDVEPDGEGIDFDTSEPVLLRDTSEPVLLRDVDVEPDGEGIVLDTSEPVPLCTASQFLLNVNPVTDDFEEGDRGGNDNDLHSILSIQPELNSGNSDREFLSHGGSLKSFETVPKESRRNMNIFLYPEKASSDEIRSLIHISKKQFLEFVDLVNVPMTKHSLLSKYSESFLFRLKLASNWSFDELGTVFCTDKKTARRIFWKILKLFYTTSLSIPNILNEYTDMEGLFRDIYQSQDPYFTKLFSAFQDPKGKSKKCIAYCSKN